MYNSLRQERLTGLKWMDRRDRQQVVRRNETHQNTIQPPVSVGTCNKSGSRMYCKHDVVVVRPLTWSGSGGGRGRGTQRTWYVIFLPLIGSRKLHLPPLTPLQIANCLVMIDKAPNPAKPRQSTRRFLTIYQPYAIMLSPSYLVFERSRPLHRDYKAPPVDR